jgi:RNA polymerase sigma-70 factor (ECF subfamily)
VAAKQTLIVHTSFWRSTLSARAPAGSVNRKKGSDATVDINDSNNGDPVEIFIVQVAALSWAATQVPEITAAIQSFLNAGFRIAAQVEFIVMIGVVIPLQRQPGFRVSENLFLNVISPAIIDETRNFFVERDHGPPADGAASFHTTRWTIVMRAAQSQAQGGHSAFAELCRLYWYPLYIFARRRGHSPDDAQDLTQGFFLHVVEHRALTGVDRLKGKFRSFLLASFQNHLSDAGDRARRLKRGGDKEFVQLDAEAAEERYRLEPVEFLTPEKMFDARWAMTVLEEALKQLRQEYASAGKTSTFEALKAFLDPNNSIAPPSYDEVANQLQVTTGGAKTLIHRLRKRYTSLLREEVGRTVSDPTEVDEEIHALCEALIATEGRLGP